jgi:hypothetical protein
LNSLAINTLDSGQGAVDFYIVAYSFGTIVMADLLTMYNRNAQELKDEFSPSFKALALLASLRTIFTIGCPYCLVNLLTFSNF